MYDNLPDFKFAEFIISAALHSDSPFNNAYSLGENVRGSLMFKAKKLLCANPSHFNHCESCILSRKCVYARLFETLRPLDADMMKKSKEIPRPYSLTALKNNNILTIRIVLFGNYGEYFPYFYFVLKSLESSKHFKILSIKNGSSKLLKGGKLIKNFTYIEANKITSTNKNIIDFITPLRIKYRGKFVKAEEFRFTHLIRGIVHRLSLIANFYGNGWNANFKDIIEKSEAIEFAETNFKWVNVERYSMRSKMFMPMGGIEGTALLPEEAKPFLPLIEIGHYTQIGKNTTFSKGYYILK